MPATLRGRLDPFPSSARRRRRRWWRWSVPRSLRVRAGGVGCPAAHAPRFGALGVNGWVALRIDLPGLVGIDAPRLTLAGVEALRFVVVGRIGQSKLSRSRTPGRVRRFPGVAPHYNGESRSVNCAQPTGTRRAPDAGGRALLGDIRMSVRPQLHCGRRATVQLSPQHGRQRRGAAALNVSARCEV